jgi:UDP-N-acetyl-D-galactosamine dehydrogenase
LEKSSKLKNNKDFYICYSPERINPGDKEHVVKKIKKLIAIPNSNIKKKVLNVYSQITKKIVLSSSIKETELSKVIENIQRDLNIALMNEIYLFCDKTNLNFNNVLNQASTKWNFVKYNPGLVGGHCLPVDPYYFSHVAKKNGLKTNVTIAGRITNEFMCNFVIKKIKKEINLNKSFKKSSDKIIFAGLSYKKNVSDIRNSLALKIYKSFQRKNKNIFAFDPLISSEKIKNSISSDDLKSIKNVKYIIFLVYHDIFKKIFKKINKKIKIIKFFDNNI